MVDLKFSLVKRDFVWIGLLVVLIGVGFVYAFGGNDPAVMGHSLGELEAVGGNAITICSDNKFLDGDGSCLSAKDIVLASGLATGLAPVAPVITNDLVKGIHSSKSCTDSGGVVVTKDGDKICKVSGNTCSALGNSWTQHKGYTTTRATTCTFNPRYASCHVPTGQYTCTTSSHTLKNKASETCLYKSAVETCVELNAMRCTTECSDSRCTADIIAVGCY